MSSEILRCPKCRGGNIIGYRGNYECIDCGHRFTLSEASKPATLTEESKALIRRMDLQKTLHKIKDSDSDVIEPSFTYDKSVEYPSIQDIDMSPDMVESALEDLAKLDILTREVSSNIGLCPVCNTHRLSVHFTCSICGSPSLEKVNVLEHLTCGYIAPEKEFHKEGQLVCPKCRKTLKALGVDYKRQRNVYKCLECGSLIPIPDRLYSCENNHQFREDELIIRNIYRYRVNPTSRNIIDQLTLDLRPIQVEGIRLGLYVRSPAVVKGKSGVEHEFSIALWKNVKYIDSPEAVIDIHLSDKPANEMTVLALYAKMIDVGVKKAILGVLPGLSEEARKLAKAYGIKVIESEDADTLVEEIRKILREVAAASKISQTL